MSANAQRCSSKNDEGTRCSRPEHGPGGCDFTWDHPDSYVQDWTPPSRRGRVPLPWDEVWRVYLANTGIRHPRAGWTDLPTIVEARELAKRLVAQQSVAGAIREALKSWNGDEPFREKVNVQTDLVIAKVRIRK